MFQMREPLYSHRRAVASGVPLGGLGTGSVEIRDDGRFHDWEIFNNYSFSGIPEEPPPEMYSEDAFFALRVAEEGASPRVRLLYHDDMKTRAVDPRHDHAGMYLFPYLRNVEQITYSGQPPFARLFYEEQGLPVRVGMEAFTPFIPFEAKDSALPLAFFTFTVENRGKQACEASLMFSLRNCAGYDREELSLRHETVRCGDGRMVVMAAEGLDPTLRTAGTTCVAALGEDVTHLAAWTDGKGLLGFSNPDTPGMCHWAQPFRDRGELERADWLWRRNIRKRRMDQGELMARPGAVNVGWHWRGAVCRKVTLQPGESKEVVFLMSWFFPNHYYRSARDRNVGHMYASRFRDAAEIARYGAENYRRLREASDAFSENLHAGSLPAWLPASLAAQLTTFPQSFWWTRGGDLLVWEGSACCQLIPAARTPWSSFQPLLFFPEVYREMINRMARFDPDQVNPDADPPSVQALEAARRQRIQQSQRKDLGGWFSQRYQRLGYDPEAFQRRGPRTTGRRTRLSREASAQQVLLDYLWTGDEDHVRELWPIVRDAVADRLAEDTDDDGLPNGQISWITYDHWFLPALNCYRCSMWLAELTCAAEIADRLGDLDTAEQFRAVAAKGAESFEQRLWNGEYYNLCFDELKGQTDPGCMADQVSGHLYLRLCGLDPVHDEQRARSALAAVFRYNRPGEQGLLNGADPQGRRDWRYFARYSASGEDEALGGQWVTPWTGTEYYVAAVMIAEGLVEEGLTVARDVYERHVAVGMLYNHHECGEHYFRAMAAWALLPAIQGLVYDAPARWLRVAPKLSPEDFDSLLLLPGLWGRIMQKREGGVQTNEVRVESGKLTLRTLSVEPGPDLAGARMVCSASVDGKEIPCECSAGDGWVHVELDKKQALSGGKTLVVQIEPDGGE